jgi:hypothetical protein
MSPIVQEPIFIPIYKNGDKEDDINCRGILLSNTYTPRRPSLEANRSSASQKIHRIKKPSRLLLSSQQPATCPYHPIY